MARYVFLDSNVLGLVSTVTAGPETNAFLDWAADAPVRGTNLVVADVNWFEVRRRLELLALLGRSRAATQLAEFDAFCGGLASFPVLPEDWGKASELWSQVRKGAWSAAKDDGLDADVILAAMAANVASQGHWVAIATANLKDFRRFVPFGGVEPYPWRDVPL